MDVRIVAATNRNLEKAVQDGTFRDDLVFPVERVPDSVVPPLRERVADIPQLAWDFAAISRVLGQADRGDCARVSRTLAGDPWPGNVRELRNIIERAVVTATGPITHACRCRRRHQYDGAIAQTAECSDQHIRSIPAEHPVADSGGRRGGRPPGPQAIHPRNPHGKARDFAARRHIAADAYPRHRDRRSDLSALFNGSRIVETAVVLGLSCQTPGPIGLRCQSPDSSGALRGRTSSPRRSRDQDIQLPAFHLAAGVGDVVGAVKRLSQALDRTREPSGSTSG